MSDKRQFLIDLGYNILKFEYEDVTKISNRMGVKPKTITLAMKEDHIPDLFFDYPEMANEHTINNVFQGEFNS